MSRFVSDRELAAALGIGRSTLWRGVKEGAVPEPIYIAGRCPRWPLEVTIEEVTRRAARRPRPEPRRRATKLRHAPVE
jgi:predicted DNA-binding transcriptional regulator AlpA